MSERSEVVPEMTIRVGHSPDPDDAFMFHALANDKIDTGPYRFVHELVDIERLNRRARDGELELTAISIHAYAHLARQYVLCPCGASMGDGYGPLVVARETLAPDRLREATFAVPGTWTSAFLALRLFLGRSFRHVVVPFDRILEVVAAGEVDGVLVDAGLVIHEGQLTYGQSGLVPVVDLGRWWKETTGLPLPLGANALRRDLGEKVIGDVTRLLRASIEYALAHRAEALDYALQFGRGLDRSAADQFVGMYVNDWTIDFGETGREAVRRFLEEGHRAGMIPLVEPRFAPYA